MNFPSLRSRDLDAGNPIFRVVTLFLYTTLLLHLALVFFRLHQPLSTISLAALGALMVLFCAAFVRFGWPELIKRDAGLVLAELTVALLVVVAFTVQNALPAHPLPWLIGLAGVFPLMLRGRVALAVITLVAAIGFGLNAGVGTLLDHSLPQMLTTLFVGLLSILLSRALRDNALAMAEAHATNRRFDAIARATRHVFMITDGDFKLKYANPALQYVIGHLPEELIAQTIDPVIHPDDITRYRRQLTVLRATPGGQMFSRHRAQHRNGQWVWLEMRGYNLLDDAAFDGMVFSIEDVSARKDAEHKLVEEHALLRAVLDLNPAMIYAKDNDGRFTISNLSFQQRFGYRSEEEIRGKTSYELFSTLAVNGRQRDAFQMADQLHQQDLDVIASGAALEDQEIHGLWGSDAQRWFSSNKYPLRDERGAVLGVLGIARDITERKEYEMRLEHQALHDALTGLPNRRYLSKLLVDAIETIRTRPSAYVLLFCDLDFFKNVNDTHGHDFGDKCLLELTRRITADLPPTDFVARFGGDEFVILAKVDLLEAITKANALLTLLSAPLIIDAVVVKIPVSIGIAMLQPQHRTPSDVIRDADAAMYQAKERGRSRVEIFDLTLQNSATKRAQMDVALRFAQERNELAIAYQPKVSLRDGTLTGFELLLRWNSPQYGNISPTEFIPIAEASGLVAPIGLWALAQACKQLKVWQQDYPLQTNLTIAVNVSMRQLLHESFLSEVGAILERTGASPQSIELEITETSAMASPLQTIENLTLLKQRGFRLALDDFGTGYSSLAYLQKLPIDVLKIDQAFVKGLGSNDGDSEIVRLILALAKTLNLDTVAEGVESAGHVAQLLGIGCYCGQGYFFSAPVNAADATGMLASDRRFHLT
ncbi:MAG: EAL domain-containing protein [Herminiimonas sp.]|nr:EAL domain-containing protein [Herminiimonas sp.]